MSKPSLNVYGVEHEYSQSRHSPVRIEGSALTTNILSASRHSTPASSHHSTPHSATSHATITYELPQENLVYSSGVPKLPHYLEGEVVNPDARYQVPTAAKTVLIKHEVVLMQRRAHLLEVYAECLPASEDRLGKAVLVPSAVYDHFPGIEQLVDKTIRGSQVAYQIGRTLTIGYYLNPKDYQVLYRALKEIATKWEAAVFEECGTVLQLPQWSHSDIPSQVWTAAEFEMFAVKYREELETFLYTVYSVHHVVQGPRTPLRMQHHMERFEKNLDSGAEDIIPKSPPMVTSITSIHSQVQNTRSNLPVPPTSVPLRGYSNNPSMLSHSHHLGEITGASAGYGLPSATSTPLRHQRHATNISSQTPIPFQSRYFRERESVYQPRPHRESQISAVRKMEQIAVEIPPSHVVKGTQEVTGRHLEDMSKVLGNIPGGSGGFPGGGDFPNHQNHSNSDHSYSPNIAPHPRPIWYKQGPPEGGPPGGDPLDGGGHHISCSPSPQVPERFRHATLGITESSEARKNGKFHFDQKLKPNIIPTWDGNGDTLSDWIIAVDDLANYGPSVYAELGQIIPTRLRSDAATWFWSLPKQTRRDSMYNWGTMQQKICEFWMSRHWLDRQKVHANKANYRELDFSKETPVQYVIRKLKLLQLVYDYTDSQFIIEIMATAPHYWNQIIDPQRCVDMEDFLNAVKYNEESLEELNSEETLDPNLEKRIKELEDQLQFTLT